MLGTFQTKTTDSCADMAARIAQHPWGETPLGPREAWPGEISCALALALASRHPVAVCVGPDHLQLYNDAAACLLAPGCHPGALGQPARDIWPAECWGVVGPQAEAVLAGRVRGWLGEEPVAFRIGEETRWCTPCLAPLAGQDSVSGLFLSWNDVTALRRADEVMRARYALLEAETERQRQLFEQAPAFICVLQGPEHVVQSANWACRALVGPDRPLVGLPLHEALPELREQSTILDGLDEAYRSGESHVSREAILSLHRAADGRQEDRVVDLVVQPILDGRGDTTGIFIAGSDVTEHVRSQQRQSLLIRELHHRVRNTLATVQGILGATSRSSESFADFRDAFAGRIAAMAKTHSLVTEHRWQKASFRALLEQELQPFSEGGNGRIMLEGPDIELPSDVAVPIGMAVHEMTTNAVKHGALSVPGGYIEIRWTATPVPDGEQLTWLWRERNGPPVQPPGREGFGTRLLQRVLAAQTRAEVRIDFAADGLQVVIILLVPSEHRVAGD